MNVIPFNQLGVRTRDGRYTQKDLIAKIRKIAVSQGYDNGTAQSTINSFVMNGIVETYNELGYQRWIEMIYQVINHEGAERRYGHDRLDVSVR
jgi:hypothetical protein